MKLFELSRFLTPYVDVCCGYASMSVVVTNCGVAVVDAEGGVFLALSSSVTVTISVCVTRIIMSRFVWFVISL